MSDTVNSALLFALTVIWSVNIFVLLLVASYLLLRRMTCRRFYSKMSCKPIRYNEIEMEGGNAESLNPDNEERVEDDVCLNLKVKDLVDSKSKTDDTDINMSAMCTHALHEFEKKGAKLKTSCLSGDGLDDKSVEEATKYINTETNSNEPADLKEIPSEDPAQSNTDLTTGPQHNKTGEKVKMMIKWNSSDNGENNENNNGNNNEKLIQDSEEGETYSNFGLGMKTEPSSESDPAQTVDSSEEVHFSFDVNNKTTKDSSFEKQSYLDIHSSLAPTRGGSGQEGDAFQCPSVLGESSKGNILKCNDKALTKPRPMPRTKQSRSMQKVRTKEVEQDVEPGIYLSTIAENDASFAAMQLELPEDQKTADSSCSKPPPLPLSLPRKVKSNKPITAHVSDLSKGDVTQKASISSNMDNTELTVKHKHTTNRSRLPAVPKLKLETKEDIVNVQNISCKQSTDDVGKPANSSTSSCLLSSPEQKLKTTSFKPARPPPPPPPYVPISTEEYENNACSPPLSSSLTQTTSPLMHTATSPDPRKIVKPNYPPPKPPSNKTSDKGFPSHLDLGKTMDSLPSCKTIEDLPLDCSLLYDEIKDHCLIKSPLKSPDHNLCDGVSDKSKVLKRQLNLAAAVERSDLFNSRKQALSKINFVAEKEFVNPIYEKSSRVIEHQFSNSFKCGQSSRNDKITIINSEENVYSKLDKDVPESE